MRPRRCFFCCAQYYGRGVRVWCHPWCPAQLLGLEASVVHHGLVTGTLLHDERWRLHINSPGWLRAHTEIASMRTILGDTMTELRGQLRQLEEHLRCASDLDLQFTILTDKCGKAKVLRDLHEDLRELIQRSHSLLARRCMSWESEARANEAPNQTR